MADTTSSNGNPTSSGESPTSSSQTLYYQEALKLAELTIKDHHSAFATIDRKSILLITLYIAIIAYLFSWVNTPLANNTSLADNKTAIYLALIASVILTIAAFIGAWALRPRRLSPPGAGIEYLTWEGFDENFNKLAKDLLNRYKGIIECNINTLSQKTTCLKISLCVGTVGIILTFAWVIFIFYHKLT